MQGQREELRGCPPSCWSVRVQAFTGYEGACETVLITAGASGVRDGLWTSERSLAQAESEMCRGSSWSEWGHEGISGAEVDGQRPAPSKGRNVGVGYPQIVRKTFGS